MRVWDAPLQSTCHSRLAWIALLIINGCSEAPRDANEPGGSLEVRDGDGEGASEDEATVVYRRVTVHSAQGDLLSEDVLGELTLDIIERSARPQLHVDEPVVYEDHVWRQELADGTIERGREIIAVPHEPTAVALDPEPFGLSSSLTAQLEGTAPDEPIPVLIRVPRGDLEILPMVPTAQATTPALQAAAAAAATTRAQLIDANAAAFAESNAALVTHIEAVGGEVASLHWTVGMISATDEMKEGMRAFLDKRKPGWLRG